MRFTRGVKLITSFAISVGLVSYWVAGNHLVRAAHAAHFPEHVVTAFSFLTEAFYASLLLAVHPLPPRQGRWAATAATPRKVCPPSARHQ